MRKLLDIQIRRGFSGVSYLTVDFHAEAKEYGTSPCWTLPEEAREAAAELLEIANRVEKMRKAEIL